MSSGSRFELNPAGIKEMLLSSDMESALMTMAAGYKGDKKAWRSHDRVAIQIYNDSNEGNSMLKELFGGGTKHEH